MILQLGSKGPEVLELKRLLVEAGSAYSLHPGFNPNSDKFDEATEDRLCYFQETHIDATGVFLDVDGKVFVGGSETWWALEHPRGASQSNYYDAKIPDGLGLDQNAILDVAVEEKLKGVHEEPMGSNAGPEVLKYGGKPGDAWCCFSVHWVHHKALGYYQTTRGRCGSCLLTLSQAKKDKRVILASNLLPGDTWIMKRYSSSSGKLVGGHTGFTLRVSEDGRFINTWEGNCANRVKIGMRKVSTIAAGIRAHSIEDMSSDWERGLCEQVSATGDSSML